MVPLADVCAVEFRASNAWPAWRVHRIDGWQVRHSPGIDNRRANSVLPIGPLIHEPVPSAIDQVETFYRGHDLPARFMISPACVPADLDRVLEGRGYHIDASTDVQWALLGNSPDLQNVRYDTRIERAPDDGWMGIYMEGVEDVSQITGKRQLLSRITSERVFVQISIDGRPVSVGLGVFDNPWTGVFCMHTLHEYRQQGFAKSVLAEIAHWSRKMKGDAMYLQVERCNPVARKFYEQSGFQTRYGYHYRTRKS